MPNERGYNIRVLPGGRYFTLREYPNSVKFLDVATGHCVRTYTYPNPIESWSFDMRDGGDEIVLIFVGMDAHE